MILMMKIFVTVFLFLMISSLIPIAKVILQNCVVLDHYDQWILKTYPQRFKNKSFLIKWTV